MAPANEAVKNREECNGESSEQRAARSDAEVGEEGPSEEREERGDGAPEQIIDCEDRSSVLGIRHGEVDENALEHEVDAGKVDGGTNDGCDPWDVGACSPAEDEETDGDTDAADQSDLKADFRGETTVADESRFDVVLLVQTCD